MQYQFVCHKKGGQSKKIWWQKHRERKKEWKKDREREWESVYAAACAPLPCHPYPAALCEVFLVLSHTSAWQTSLKPSSCRHPLFYIEATKKCNMRWKIQWSTHWWQQRETFSTAWSGWIATPQQSQWNNQDNNSNLLLMMTHTRARALTRMHTHARIHTAVGVFGNACLYFTMELVGECLKCLFQLTRGVPALVV